MINGKPHRLIVWDILKDGFFHHSRELLNAGLCEYRQPIDQLRKRGCLIEASDKENRPGFTLLNPGHDPFMDSVEPWQRHQNVTSEARRSKLAKELSKRHPIEKEKPKQDLFDAA